MKLLLRFLVMLALMLAAPPVALGREYKASTASATMRRASLYSAAINAAAARHSVNARLLWTIAYLESGFQPQLVSPKGARGMMQFIPATGRRYGLLTRMDLHDSLRSIDAAARYVRDLIVIFHGRVDLVLAGYNAGEKAVIKASYKVPPYRETRSYVARGLSLFASIGADVSRALQAARPTTALKRRRQSPSPVRPSRSIYFHS